jgi:type IV pilus assembly protein PilY1
MNTPYRCPPKLARTALSVAGALGVTSLDAATLTIATEPLGTATTSIKPNVMFILDDSGSMSRDFMPEYVVDSHNPTVGNTAGCFDSGDDDSGSITGRPDACTVGDPPYMSPDFNTIYYNPAIFYRPALNYNGNERTVQNAANTTSWTAVRTDDYNRDNVDQLGNSTTTVNLATNYPDRVWCISTSDASGGGNCRQNSAYLYPNYQFRRGETDGGSTKYIGTAPYYYRAQTAQYCRVDGTDCRSGNQVNPTLHKLQAPEFCLDSELTNCAVGSAVTSLHVFSGIRWCNNPELQEDPVTDNPRLRYCQRKKIGSFIYAKHLGTTVNQTGTFAAVPNEGQITVTRVAAGGGTINTITIGGTTVASGISIPAGTTSGGAAALIASAINAHASFDATFSGANVIITQATAGSSGAGANILVNGTGTPTQAASGTLTLSTVNNNVVRTISSITVGSTQLLCGISSTQSFGNSVSAQAPSGSIVASSGWNTAVEISTVMRAIADRITACSGVNGGYTASKVGNNEVEIRGPLSAGSTINGQGIAISVPNGFGLDSMTGGADTPDIGVATSPMSGGADAFSGTRAVRIGVGKFTRTDIVPTVDSYPKAATRSDCLGGTSCTYAEEMTNFANWYTFYRTRMNMMKTAAGRAFVTIDDTYRVGFITINPGSPVGVNEYLRIADFTSGVGGHKQSWYSKFYFQTAGGGTPLRQALSRVGWMFGGQLDTDLTLGIPTTDDPMTASCQPNFAILSTDGYWNGSGGKQLDGADMGNHDNTNSGYSTRAAGAYDGNLLSGTDAGSSAGGRNTLADVAMYYYKTDLRTSGSYATDNVPITNKDTNPAQHMVTFTLGLGLDGELTYRPDYETAATGDFAQIKQGTKNWPSPKADAPTALDDLWHAAVNGRGVFFSARDPQTLSTALIDTLSNLQTRIGAGAAAATSNLQPVAGDNFAFTAQYQTADWIGDLKARTIDLSSGVVSSITLWSAASLLDLMSHTDRNLFTYDELDGAGNQMKHLCWPAAGGATCTDGTGLTAAEQLYFAPTLLLQYPFGGDAGKLATASADKVLNFLRGDRTYEDAGAGDPTDLFRLRDSLLGDIINAQPAYVKNSPFNYGDNGYDAFKKCTQGLGTGCPATLFPDPSKPRPGTVYAAANDGFLHAFETDVNNNPYYQTAGIGTALTADDTFSCSASVCNVGNGVERWAYMPGLILPSAIRLANKPYSHRYFTDGSPVAADICISTPCGGVADWRTIVVAGLNSGGVGYYALDVTNPLPSGVKVLWEFTNKGKCWTDAEIDASPQTVKDDCHLGLSYGNPIVTKRKSDGKWVVIVTSGYNNTVGGSPGTDTGDGAGYIYILDAHTGVILKRLTTGVGTAASPSGLAKINGFATDSVTDNTVLAVYGGDLEGNLWRFDLDSAGANYLRVIPVAVARDSGGVAQPITVKPELGLVPSAPDARVVLFGTGKFLENSDKSDTSAQTIYALKDVPATGTGPIISDVRNTTIVKPRSFAAYTATDTTRTVTAGPAPSWGTEFGWLLDLPESGERVNVDPQLQLGTLIVSSNVPSGDSCTAGGSSWLNFLDYLTGSYVQGASGNMASTKFGSSLAVGINVIMLPGGKVVTIVTTADNQQLTKDTPVPATAFAGRRVSWRELVRE